MSHTIAIVNQKGGTGKTTTVVNLGRAFQQIGKKVLLIDLDAQANLTYSLGIIEPIFTIADLLLQNEDSASVILDVNGLDLLPSNNFLAEKEFTFIKEGYSFDILKQHIFSLKSLYDVILIDCPPNVSFMTAAALTASDDVLIPMQMDALSIQGLNQIMYTVDEIVHTLNPDLGILGVLPVMVDKRKTLTSEAHSFIHENYKLHIFEPAIRSNVKAAEAPSHGLSVIEYSPNCNASIDYKAASKVVWKAMKKQRKAVETN